MKPLTYQQVILCLGLIAALIVSGIYLPSGAAQVAQAVMLVFAFFRDPNPSPPKTPEDK